MGKITIVVHGGAGPDSPFIQQNQKDYEQGLHNAVEAGYAVLESGGTAVEAVEAAVRVLEDDPLFNAGRGSALTATAQAQMCTSIMEGKELRAGAAAIVRDVRNPITLAKALLEDKTNVYLGGPEATEVARDLGLEIEHGAYFVTDHQWKIFEEERKKHPKESASKVFRKYMKRQHGTVGAVAVDSDGNIAAGTSTGGTEYCQPGRIGDSSMIGVGTYANNRTAAISSTGDGEYLIRAVMAHAVSATIEHTGCSVQEACDHQIHVRNKDTEGDMGVIAVDAEGNIGISFNSERLHRGWRTENEKTTVAIYRPQ